jgi:uncharacterized membrane protein
MTASKSSRARNARAQANAARNRNGAAAETGSSANASSSARTVTAVKAPAPVKASTAKASPAKASPVKASPVKASTVKASPVKASPVKAGSVKANGSTGTARRGGASPNGAGRSAAVATRGGGVATQAAAPERSGSRLQALRAGLTGAGTQRRPAAPFWLQITTWLVAMAGLGVSIYLTIAHFTESTLAGCSESGLVNCTKVTTSPQSYVFGIPVAVLGLAFYLFAVAAMSPWAWRSARREVHIVRLASTVVGIGFVLYLIYAELFIIGSICLYCTSVHILTFVLFALTAFAAAAWGLDPAKNDR